MSGPACPYCGTILAREPKRPAKCPHCAKRIYPKPKQPFFKKNLLTEAEKVVSDHFESLTSAAGYNVTLDTYSGTQAKLGAKFKTPASWSDVTWSIYHQLADKFARAADFEHLGYVYAGMANFLWQERRDFRWTLAESHKYRLLYFKNMGAKSARTYVYAFGCAACEALKDKTYDLDEAIKRPPFPPEGCTCALDKNLPAGYCVCSFAANF